MTAPLHNCARCELERVSEPGLLVNGKLQTLSRKQCAERFSSCNARSATSSCAGRVLLMLHGVTGTEAYVGEFAGIYDPDCNKFERFDAPAPPIPPKHTQVAATPGASPICER